MSWVDYTWHDYLKVDGKLIAERFCPVGTTCSSTTAWRYFVTDSLGSVATVTDSTASPDAPHTERDAYDPWGKKRNATTGADDNSCYSASISSRGYTGHEHMNGVCLINENARVYDPLLGRFMAPDDVIADIYDGQGLNRYTYVDNRPMTLTDPTGHSIACEGDGQCNKGHGSPYGDDPYEGGAYYHYGEGPRGKMMPSGQGMRAANGIQVHVEDSAESSR